MTRESIQDAFERRYTEAFRQLAANYGVFVKYDRDRAARDLGLHLTRKRTSGEEQIAGSLIWFQMKGLMRSSLSKERIKKIQAIPIRLKVRDLQFWYLFNGPTYLVVFVESIKEFLILDIVGYISSKYGKKIFTMEQRTLTVPIPISNKFDDQAFSALLRKGTAEEWARVLDAKPSELHFCQRDFSIIWRLGTANERKVKHRLDVTDWQTKLRGEVDFLERRIDDNGEWELVRKHMQYMFSVDDLEEVYPYLVFSPANTSRQNDIEYWGNENGEPSITLADGTSIFGEDVSGEYHEYKLRPKLNTMGKRLYQRITTLIQCGMVDVPKADEFEGIDIAPWHNRF